MAHTLPPSTDLLTRSAHTQVTEDDLPEPKNKPENITSTIGPQRVQLFAGRYDTPNLLNIIHEQTKILHWQHHSITRLEQFPLRRTLEDSIKRKDAHIKELTRKRLPEMMWWGKDAAMKQIEDLQKENDKITSERDRWKGIAEGKPWWTPEVADEGNILGKSYAKPPLRNSRTGLFPPEVFEQARSKRDGVAKVVPPKYAETDMERREEAVMRGSQALVDGATAAVGYNPVVAPSNSTAQTTRQNASSSVLVNAKRPRIIYSRSLSHYAIEETSVSSGALQQRCESEPPPKAAKKESNTTSSSGGPRITSLRPGILRINNFRSPPRDGTEQRSISAGALKRQYEPEDAIEAGKVARESTLSHEAELHSVTTPRGKRQRKMSESLSTTRARLPRVCKRNRSI